MTINGQFQISSSGEFKDIIENIYLAHFAHSTSVFED